MEELLLLPVLFLGVENRVEGDEVPLVGIYSYHDYHMNEQKILLCFNSEDINVERDPSFRTGDGVADRCEV